MIPGSADGQGDDGNAATMAGKSASDESFPVASRILSPAVRGDVLAFYAFARAADDIADSPPDRYGISRLEVLELVDRALDAPVPESRAHKDVPHGYTLNEDVHRAMRAATDLGVRLRARRIDVRHARDLLVAFRRDVKGVSVENWSGLLDYCRWSAMPVGRFLLDIHGEDSALREPADALCSALQILNHVQDCRVDYDRLGRIYLPRTLFEANGVSPSDLSASASGPGLRAVLDACLNGVDRLLTSAQSLPRDIRCHRLRAQAQATLLSGRLLEKRLRKADPLAIRVELSKVDRLRVVVAAALDFMNPYYRMAERFHRHG